MARDTWRLIRFFIIVSRGVDETRGASAMAISAVGDGSDGSGGACADARTQLKNKTRLIWNERIWMTLGPQERMALNC